MKWIEMSHGYGIGGVTYKEISSADSISFCVKDWFDRKSHKEHYDGVYNNFEFGRYKFPQCVIFNFDIRFNRNGELLGETGIMVPSVFESLITLTSRNLINQFMEREGIFNNNVLTTAFLDTYIANNSDENREDIAVDNQLLEVQEWLNKYGSK